MLHVVRSFSSGHSRIRDHVWQSLQPASMPLTTREPRAPIIRPQKAFRLVRTTWPCAMFKCTSSAFGRSSMVSACSRNGSVEKTNSRCSTRISSRHRCEIKIRPISCVRTSMRLSWTSNNCPVEPPCALDHSRHRTVVTSIVH